VDFSSLGLGELDWVFVVIILLSTLLGVSRGMVREIFALVGWVAAFFVSLYCSADLAAILPFQAHMGLMTRTFVSIVLIVIGCVFLAGLVGRSQEGRRREEGSRS
jgi:membrane protein required for colicin V production